MPVNSAMGCPTTRGLILDTDADPSLHPFVFPVCFRAAGVQSGGWVGGWVRSAMQPENTSQCTHYRITGSM